MDSRVVGTLGLSFTSVLIAGCDSGQLGDDDEGGIRACGEELGGSLPGPPTLVSARVDSDKIVHLTFTEPLASVSSVDPGSFSISNAWSWGYDSTYTSYYDPMLMFCLSTDFCIGEYTDVVELGCAGNDPNTLMLRLDTFHPQICENIELFSDYDPSYVSPLLAHFDASLGVILDLDGEALASFGADFVSAPDEYLDVEGEFPNYPIRIPIECD